ncbi:ABC transporter permease [Pectobacterium peruviense]|uniref:Sugar ABC transporter permease n=1 Tax=Pectobacterium peruviense TaxID=2066479 RepID=A0ABX4S2Z3_9GAMM|nr:ABC transporter permease [Pectobacterium peruviense]KML68286.1 sugar ABC transporter permease [Pectobacterium peruviense]PKX81260.1 sugar ABC transporter permease [Pectobacterium peruviense]PKX84811.1 sugar ABC transporter permease [Pectobacterium peruviense]
MSQQPLSKTITPSNTRGRFDPIAFFERFGVFIFMILLLIFFQSQNGNFLSERNITNILTEVSIYGIMAVGMTFVILTAGIDLSVGSILAVCAITAASVIKGDNFTTVDPDAWYGLSWLVALGVCLAMGTFIGFLHGLGVTKLRLPPFIVTLGGMTIWRGLTLVMNDGAPIAGFDPGYRWWGRGEILGISVPIWIFALVALLGYLALHKTRWGRFVYAIGGNTEAARLAGVNVQRVLVSVYVVIGCLAGLAGFILSARLGSAEAVAGITFELRVIASVVIGGTSLMGGYGRISGTIIGSIIMGILINGLVLMNVSAYYQQIITGLIIVLAVAFDTYAKSRRGAI